MPMSTERVPNDPLTGPECIEFCCHLLRKALQNEWAFKQGSSYPRIGIELTAKFHFLSVSMPKVNPIFRVEAPAEQPPLKDIPEGAAEGVLGLKIEKIVENPNLERVHAGLPITVMTKQGAMPGKMFPTVERHEVVYDPKDYPSVDPPTITDITAETASEWNVALPEPPSDAVEVTEPEPEVMAPHIPKRRGRPPKNA